MTPETAQKIYNNLRTDVLELYVNDRIQELYKQMELAVSVDDLRNHQGAIKELKRLLGIKDIAHNVLVQEQTKWNQKSGQSKG